MRQNLDVNAGFVHFAQAKLAHVEEPPLDVRHALAFASGKHGDEIGVPIMLFQGNDGGLRRFGHLKSLRIRFERSFRVENNQTFRRQSKKLHLGDRLS